jgi:hypothetical protein
MNEPLSGEAIYQTVPLTASGTEEIRTRNVEGRRAVATKGRKEKTPDE